MSQEPSFELPATPRVVSMAGHELIMEPLYRRMWDLAQPQDDGSRVYVSTGRQALKWLIAELAGTPAKSGKTLPANNAMRRQVHEVLEAGWAERLNQRTFRLLITPGVTDARRPDRDGGEA